LAPMAGLFGQLPTKCEKQCHGETLVPVENYSQIRSAVSEVMRPKQKDTYTGCSRKKLHKVYGTTILQLYVINSCGFQQNVQKKIAYMTETSVWI